MRKTVVFSLCLILLASVVPAKNRDKQRVDVPRKTSTLTDADAWRQLLTTPGPRRASAAMDTTFLLVHDFEGPGAACDAMGWTLNDATQQLDNYWHVDDFTGLTGINGGLVPLEGSQSMWCGARPDNNHPVNCSYLNLPGYADHWYQWLRTDQCLTVTGDVDLSFRIYWNSETDYDYAYVQWDQCDDNWQDLVDGGLDGVGQWDTTLTVAASSHSGNIRFRFLFRSDGSWSDGDGNIDTDGACTIDALQVDDGNGNALALEDFEDEAVGDNHGDDWTSGVSEGYGELAALFSGAELLQEDPCYSNPSCVWAFISGSTANYACGTPPHPEQSTVPYVNSRGQYVDQQIWSPWIELSGEGSVFELDFSTYWDLSFSSFVFSDWHVRGIDSTTAFPCPSPWFGDGIVDNGGDKAWGRNVRQIGTLIPTGSTHIQISLDAIDYCGVLSWCPGGCHSHAPLYDDVSVYRLGWEGPQWTIQDMHQFQDNFPDDETFTGTARADMAMDKNWAHATQAIVPGDSAVVRVSDPAAGLAQESNGKAAVFCYVSIDGPNSGTAATSLICDSHYDYVATENWGDRTWHKFQADTCYTDEGLVAPDDYNFDFCDDLFVPGDSIWFFWGARNADGVYTYASAALPMPGNQTRYGNEAANNADEFQVLPAVGRSVPDGGLNGGILYVDGMNFRGAQPYFDTAFDIMRILRFVDRFDIRDPSAGIGNHPGSRVKNVRSQLHPIYRVIIWNTGDLETAFADGTGDRDKSDDTGMCLMFLDELASYGGIYLNGDDVASEWLQMWGASAISLRNTYMDFDVTASDHQPVVGYNPWGIGVPGGMFSVGGKVDTLVVQGGCPSPNTFDILEPDGAKAIVGMNYHDWTPDSTFVPAVLSQETTNAVGDSVGFVLSGFSFHEVRDHDAGGLPARVTHLSHILSYLYSGVGPVIGPTPTVATRNHLDQNVPNPFNPTTTIRYQVKESGPVSLRIYNVAGQLVKTLVDGHRNAGHLHEATWNGHNDGGQPVASGVYFYKLVAKGFTQTKKMVILK